MCLHHRAVRTSGSQRPLIMRAWWPTAGLILAGTSDGPSGSVGADRAVGAHGFREPGPQDPHGGRRDARRGHPYRSCRDAARRTHRSGAGIPPDGALDGRDVLADVHVRSCPPARRWRRARWLAPGRWARAPARRRWWSIWTPRSARPRQTKTRRRVRLHQRARLSPAARCTRRHRRGARRPHAQRLRGVLARRGALRRRARREPATRRGCRADHGARRLGILVTQTDRPSRTPTTSNGRSPSPSDPLFAQRSKQSPAPHGPTSTTCQRRPRPGRRDPIHHRPRQSQAHRPPRRAPHPPRRHRTTTTVARLATPRIHHQHQTRTAAAGRVPPRATPSSSSPSATSKKAPDSNTSPQATTARTAHGSHAPCSPTTSATGPQHSRARRRPRTAPAAPDSSPSPPCW